MDEWIDEERYPFESNFLGVEAGDLHYLDEGNGETILFLHGNPTWSFMYRDAIKLLRSDFRCIAPDHIGFGLSDKPDDWSYRPWNHADNLKSLVDSLGLEQYHLVVHDWGGPIGLSTALDHPDSLKSVTILNTWMWSVKDRLDARLFGRVLGSSVGRYLITNWNLFNGTFMKWGVSSSDALNEQIHRHYLMQFQEDDSMKGVWRFPKDIVEADQWLVDLWARRDALKNKPSNILWGLRDPAFGRRELRRWIDLFEDPNVHRYSEASHYLMEDCGSSIGQDILEFARESST